MSFFPYLFVLEAWYRRDAVDVAVVMMMVLTDGEKLLFWSCACLSAFAQMLMNFSNFSSIRKEY